MEVFKLQLRSAVLQCAQGKTKCNREDSTNLSSRCDFRDGAVREMRRELRLTLQERLHDRQAFEAIFSIKYRTARTFPTCHAAVSGQEQIAPSGKGDDEFIPPVNISYLIG